MGLFPLQERHQRDSTNQTGSKRPKPHLARSPFLHPGFTPVLTGGELVSAPRGTSGTGRGRTRAWHRRPGAPRAHRGGRHAADVPGGGGGPLPRGRAPAPLPQPGPLPIPLLFEERRQRTESLQVLDGRGHHDAGQPAGRRPGRRHLAARSSGRAGDDEEQQEEEQEGRQKGEERARSLLTPPPPPPPLRRCSPWPGWESARARAPPRLGLEDATARLGEGARAEVPPVGRGRRPEVRPVGRGRGRKLCLRGRGSQEGGGSQRSLDGALGQGHPEGGRCGQRGSPREGYEEGWGVLQRLPRRKRLKTWILRLGGLTSAHTDPPGTGAVCLQLASLRPWKLTSQFVLIIY